MNRRLALIKSCLCLCVSVRLCLSVIDSTIWLIGRINKYWYFLSGNLEFGLEKSWKNHGTFFWNFCGNPEASLHQKYANNNKCMFIIDILALWKKKKNPAVTKTTPPPEDNHSYWNTMTGTNSSIDRLILQQNVEINSNWCFSYDVFSGMKSSTTWNGNAIAQSPRKMSWVQRCFKYQWYAIFNGLSNDHRCNSSFIHHL